MMVASFNRLLPDKRPHAKFCNGFDHKKCSEHFHYLKASKARRQKFNRHFFAITVSLWGFTVFRYNLLAHRRCT